MTSKPMEAGLAAVRGMEEEPKLLPCPFCGGTPSGAPNWHHGFYIDCVCPVNPKTSFCKTKESAIREWNTRAPNLELQTLKQERDRLKAENAELVVVLERLLTAVVRDRGVNDELLDIANSTISEDEAMDVSATRVIRENEARAILAKVGGAA